MRACLSALAATFAVLAAPSALAQDITRAATVVGFSKDGKTALVRWQEQWMDQNVAAIAVARFDLATGKVTRKHDVVTRKDIEAATKGDAIDEKAVAKVRGKNWTELEKQLKKDGFTVEPAYAELKREGPEVGHAKFTLPGGVRVFELCTPSKDGDTETCALYASRGERGFELVPDLFGAQMPSPMTMDFLARAYVDPKGKYLVTLARHTTLGTETGGDAKNLSAGLRSFEIAKIEAELK
ncbi:MAG TPA: hypothetical protein VGK67_04570 [Myxococcales bacterium]|jgi:Cu/Ag efflux protein CusF